jgi:hypothetical protein
MENLEDTIIEKLNKLLNSDKLIIRPRYPINRPIYPTVINMFNFGLFKLTDEFHVCLYCWNTIYDMLFSRDCIFNVHNKISFCKGDSLEEIIIKLDLMGI